MQVQYPMTPLVVGEQHGTIAKLPLWLDAHTPFPPFHFFGIFQNSWLNLSNNKHNTITYNVGSTILITMPTTWDDEHNSGQQSGMISGICRFLRGPTSFITGLIKASGEESEKNIG